VKNSEPPYNRQFLVQSLRNAGRLPDPDDYKVFEPTTGINLYYDFLTEERVAGVKD